MVLNLNIIDTMPNILATSHTYFKKEEIDSTRLKEKEKKTNNQYLYPIRRDTLLKLRTFKPTDSNHYKVAIAELPGGCLFDTGFVYAPHWGLVESEDDDLFTQSEIHKFESDAVNRQVERLKKYLKDGTALDLSVPTRYFSQRDNYRDAHRTCNSSSNAMYLDWLLRVAGRKQLQSDDVYIKEVFNNGDTIYHGVQTAALREWGFKTKWMTDVDLPFVEDLLESGFPVVANILHRGSETRPSGGHVILLIAYKNGTFIAHDPYGTLESNYSNRNGAFSRINRETFKRRWQGGYRILA